MLPELLISKFKSRIRSRISSNTNLDSELCIESDSNPRLYLHSRRRYLINSIPLLSIVALLVGNSGNRNDDKRYTSSTSNPTHVVWWRSAHCRSYERRNRTRASQVVMTPSSRIKSWSKLTISAFALLGTGFLGNSCYATTETLGDSSASLTLDTSNVEVKVAPGNAGYVSKNIELKVNNARDYTLTIAAPAVLSEENNSDSKATFWGYAYGQNGELSSMNYTEFNGNVHILESGGVSTNSNKTLALMAKFDEGVTTGHYKAKIGLSLSITPNTVTYTLNYDANGGSGAPTNQTCTTDSAFCEVVVSDVVPTKLNSKFVGWADSADTSMTHYKAGVPITLTGDKTIYAIWTPTFDGITTMQEMTNAICTSASIGETAVLTDTRDNTKYAIRKHEDQRCWMTENLRIINKTITSANSGTTNSFTIPTSSVDGFDSDYRFTPKAYVQNNTGYYNHYTAVGGSNTTTTSITNSSICPKGWRMPLATGTKEAQILYDTIGSAQAMMQEPYNFGSTGYISSSGSISGASDGIWWMSGSAANSSTAYYMVIDAYEFGAGSLSSSARGYAIRCIAI